MAEQGRMTTHGAERTVLAFVLAQTLVDADWRAVCHACAVPPDAPAHEWQDGIARVLCGMPEGMGQGQQTQEER